MRVITIKEFMHDTEDFILLENVCLNGDASYYLNKWQCRPTIHNCTMQAEAVLFLM